MRESRVRAVCAFVYRTVLPVCAVGWREAVATAGVAVGRVHAIPLVYSGERFFVTYYISTVYHEPGLAPGPQQGLQP